MERLIELGIRVMKDAYKNGGSNLEDYLGDFSMEELTDFRFFRMLNKYGRFSFHYEDKIWTNYKLTCAGEQFVEKGEALKYDGKAVDSDWIGLILMTVGFGIAGIILSVLLYKLTIVINIIDKDVVLRVFQATTVLIIVAFCRIYKDVHNGEVWKKNKINLLFLALIILYMIVYESICFEDDVVDFFSMHLQLGCLGTVVYHTKKGFK